MADSLQERKSLFVAGIKPLLKTEQSNTVKKYMTLVIISMAQHDYLSLEGGEEILEWVCLNCATPQSVVLEWEQKQASKQKVRNFPPPPPFFYLFIHVFISFLMAGEKGCRWRENLSCSSSSGL